MDVLKFVCVSTAILKVCRQELFQFVLRNFSSPVHILLTLDSSNTGFVLHGSVSCLVSFTSFQAFSLVSGPHYSIASSL